eukprot:6176486-Pleurochrysis_carterae.AAC.1
MASLPVDASAQSRTVSMTRSNYLVLFRRGPRDTYRRCRSRHITSRLLPPPLLCEQAQPLRRL